MPNEEDVALASLIEDNSDIEETNEPKNNNQINKENLTPPELAEQYNKEFTEYLAGVNLVKEIKEKGGIRDPIFKEHSYCKRQ
ncbi:MAG: hypothetical protein WAL30_00360 [Candidatus Aquirickettsiella sp.]